MSENRSRELDEKPAQAKTADSGKDYGITKHIVPVPELPVLINKHNSKKVYSFLFIFSNILV